MSAVLNKVQLLGHIGQEPKFTVTKEGLPLASASLATNESFKKEGEWKTMTEWHNLVFFGKLSSIAERLQKGSLVYLEGKIRSNHWIDKKGVRRQTTSIVVQSIQWIDNVKSKEISEDNNQPAVGEEYLSQIHTLLGEDDLSF